MKKAYVLIILITILFVGCGAEDKTTIEEILRLVELDDESVKIVSGTDNAPHSNTQPKVEEKPLQQNNDDMEMLDL